jgi:hypothetical protein
MTEGTIRTPRRLASAAAAAVAVAVTIAMLGAATSSAHWSQKVQGCTGVSGDGVTCFMILGIPGTTHVAQFIQSRTKAGGLPQICNYQARFTVRFRRNNNAYWARNSSYHQGCFYSYRATRTVNVERNFLSPSKACGSWYEDGTRLGTACNSLTARRR